MKYLLPIYNLKCLHSVDDTFLHTIYNVHFQDKFDQYMHFYNDLLDI